ncbi:hypothetical protein DC366_04525 [Pelagivirga sediminicola]|uniref:Uncharacterized protein n=1 Tax=Pelagivirga sediminicola TaxID=2170575 RepID=A0A2T7G9F3_9RHOB|nr:hypothetical protein [Pelagivirga sediminicola]PVA11043.1 hypothetical protein DC366_04525 [Pelagivirga sediminicola]
MSIPLKGLPPCHAETIIALPCLRIGAIVDNDVRTEGDLRSALHDLFAARFDTQISFLTIGTDPARAYRAIKATTAKRQQLRAPQAAPVVNGTRALWCARLYGPDTTALQQPYLPYFEIVAALRKDLLSIQFAVPHDMSDLRDFADKVHAILGNTRLRWGYQGFGFGTPPFSSFGQRNLLPAHERFRAAVMSAFDVAPEEALFRMDNVARRIGDYTPGIPDMGWRTYVGADYRDRLGDPAPARGGCNGRGPRRGGLRHRRARTRMGDVNAGENLSALAAAYAYLRPAYADQSILDKRMWGDRTPAEKAATRGYFQRLSKGSLP